MIVTSKLILKKKDNKNNKLGAGNLFWRIHMVQYLFPMCLAIP